MNSCNGSKLKELAKGKKVLFITTKNIDYIRNTQEIRILESVAEKVEIVCSNKSNYLLRILAVWKQIKQEKIQRNDLIFLGFSPQLVVPFIGRKFKGKLVIMDFFISIYDTLICDRKKFKQGTLIANLCHKLDEVTLKRANHVITDTKAHADYFISEFHGNPDIFETIYLEADLEVYYPRLQKKTENLKDKFVVLYFGSILPLQGVDVVLGAIRKLKEKDNLLFDIIGPIPQKYNKPLQNNVKYTEWLPQKELAEHIANADLCLAGHFSADIDKAKRTIPGKAYIYEMMQKPMILGDGMANHEIYSSDMKHQFVKMGDEKMLADKIVTMSQSLADRQNNL